MRSRPIVLAVIAVSLGGYAMLSRKGSETPQPKLAAVRMPDEIQRPIAPRAVAMQNSPELPTPEVAPPAAIEPPPPVAAKPETMKPVRPKPPKAAGPKQGSKKSPLSPYAMLARDALNFVGADPDAELVWAQAINDPTLAADTRQDLIEDLNENGFADPKRLTIDDLPLIEARLDLIETLAPFAMDDTNLDAFAEAYKDLLNMQAKLTKP